jgi:hypothetical protein
LPPTVAYWRKLLIAAGEKFSFFAYEGPNRPIGYAKIVFPPSENYPLGFRVQGHVTCFTVDAPNAVRFGFKIEKGSGSIPPGSRSFTFYVEDNGKHNSQSLDIMGTGFWPTVPTECPAQGGATPIVKGDIKVHTGT